MHIFTKMPLGLLGKSNTIYIVIKSEAVSKVCKIYLVVYCRWGFKKSGDKNLVSYDNKQMLSYMSSREYSNSKLCPYITSKSLQHVKSLISKNIL